MDWLKILVDLGKQFFEKKVFLEFRQWFFNLMLEVFFYGIIYLGFVLRDEDFRKDFVLIKVLVLILYGKKDKIVLFDFVKELKCGIKQLELVLFVNSGYGVFYEEKEKINSLIVQFVKL